MIGSGAAAWLQLCLAVPAGVLLGLVHFGTLHWAVRLYAGRHGLRAAGLQALRLVVLAVALGLVALAGAPALIGATAGILGGRHLVLSRRGGTP